MEYELALKIYKNMLLSRALDEKCKQLLELNVFVPNFHSGTGQEATSVVPPMALGKSDYYFYTHRDYGGLIARGVPLIKVVGDLMLKKSGSNQGFGGIMHSVSPELGPDMTSVAFNSHDEHFQPDPSIEANEMYAIHTRNELESYAIAANDNHVKLELEVFQPGAIYNVNFIDRLGILPHPLYATLFIGWPGGTWMPPTPESLMFMVKYLPTDVNWNVSVMNPEHAWEILSLAISMGGHVRVGYEDNPFLERGKYATSCHLLVEKIVRIADELGRKVATPNEARKIIWGSD